MRGGGDVTRRKAMEVPDMVKPMVSTAGSRYWKLYSPVTSVHPESKPPRGQQLEGGYMSGGGRHMAWESWTPRRLQLS